MAGLDLSAFDNVVPLGSGGLGDVSRATRRSTGGEVAIKVLRDWSDRDVAWQRTQRELRALVDLRGHANVVNVEEVLEAEDSMAIVMEYAPGGSVLDLLQVRGGRLALPETLLIGEQTAAALGAAHERGIIHRDIKPHNLLIGSFGQVKVCDFGIASLTRSEAVRDRTSSLSIRYASPEELRGEASVGPAADVYSLAATLHQLLTGQYLPQPDGTAGSLPLRSWSAPDDIPSDVEVEFRSLVMRSADRDPAKRPTAPELRDRFEVLAGRLGSHRVRALPLSGAAAAGGAGTQAGVAGGVGSSPVGQTSGMTEPGHDGAASGGGAAALGGAAAVSALFAADDGAVRGSAAAPSDFAGAATIAGATTVADGIPATGAGTEVLSTASAVPPPGPGGSMAAAGYASDEPGDTQGRTALVAFAVLAVLLGGAVVAFGTGLFGGGSDDTAAATPTTELGETPTTVEPAPTTIDSTVAVTTPPVAVTTAAPATTIPATTPPTAAPTTAVPTTVAPTTTLPERYNGRKCPGAGSCIEMQSISLIDGEYWIGWNSSFAPDTGGVHAHFFWDIYDPSQVGSASANQAPWELTADQTFVPSDEMRLANRPPDATGICVTAADSAHAVIDPAFFHCALVEAGDFGGASPVDLFEVEDLPPVDQ